MPLVKPPTFGDAPRIRVMNPLSEVLCDYFEQVLVMFGYMQHYKEYEVVLRDYFATELQIKFDGAFILRVSLDENPQEVYLEVLSLDGTKTSPTVRVRLSTLYTKSPMVASRLFAQRLSGYLP